MYQIGQFSKIVGLTPDTIKYYEKNGFITPKVNPSNGYRCFLESHALEILAIRMLRGFKVDVVGINDIKQDSSIHDINNILLDKKEQLKEQIEQAQQLIKKIDYVCNSFGRIENELNKCVIREFDAVYRLKKGEGSEVYTSDEISTYTKKLVESLPYSYLTIRVCFDELMLNDALKYNWGIGISKADFNMLGFEESKIFEYTPNQTVVSTIIIKNTVLPITSDDLLLIKEYILEKKLTVAGDVMIRLLGSAFPNGKCEYYYSVVVPIAK
ncbi:MAG: MerR family transcriptional regulator [Angelakisella sp.]